MANTKKIAEPEDIFSDTDKSQLLKKTKISPTPAIPSVTAGQPKAHRPPWVVIMIFSVVVIGTIIWLLLTIDLQVDPTVKNNTNTSFSQPAVVNIDLNLNQTSNDQDGDGLTDDTEAALGTNPGLSDSDQDGLFDREEVKVYLSNPLLADSDNDSTSDGAEVRQGTNPNGSGLLRDLPAAIQELGT